MIDCIKLKKTIKMEKKQKKLKMEKLKKDLKINKHQQKVLYFLELIII